jgi:polysaccharide chain length determinant protein (PEP-CTERM system associated)
MDVEDYIDVIRRHWAWIVGPTFAALVAAVVVAFLWPDTYVSYAVMRITPAQIPERIVASNFNMQMAERLNTMLQDVTSRDSLIGIIRKFNLYPSQLKKKPLEDVVEDMRTKVRINILDLQRGGVQRTMGSAFRIDFSYDNRKDAQNVVKELVASFSNQNLIVRRRQSNLTTDFLSDELKTAKENLDKIEAELTTFRQQNTGRLPEELGANLQQLNSLEFQLTSANDALSRAGQDKLMLETQLQNLKRQASSMVVTTEEEVAGTRNERLEQLNKFILDQETSIQALREQYKDNHPDIRAARARLDVMKKERDRIEANESASSKNAVRSRKVANPMAAKMLEDLNSQIAMTQGQIQVKTLEMDDRMKAQDRLRSQIKDLQGRIQSRPVGENQYAKLTRDHALAKARYDEFNVKKGQSEMANKLEERSAGENLELLDPASMPLKPTQPNRWLIVGIGVGLGVAVGLCLAGAKEMKDSTLKNVKDVRAYTNLQVLASIPLLENALLVRRKRRLLWLAWSSAMTLGIMAMSGSMYYYYFGIK